VHTNKTNVVINITPMPADSVGMAIEIRHREVQTEYTERYRSTWHCITWLLLLDPTKD